MATNRYKSQVTWDDGEMLDVEFRYYAGTPPTYYGDAPYPGDPPELEIIELWRNKQPFEVSAEDQERLENEIFENISDHIDEGPDPDYYYDARIDEDM